MLVFCRNMGLAEHDTAATAEVLAAFSGQSEEHSLARGASLETDEHRD